MNKQREQTLYIPLSLQAHQVAKEFATEQTSAAKSKQVYLNTLSVYAVHRYLKWLGIETNISKSDCWNPILRHKWNTADLIIPQVGTLECCSVLPGESFISLSEKATKDRIGYLAVQFSEHLDRVQLIGFARQAVKDTLEIQNLLSLDDFVKAVVPHPGTKPETEFTPPVEILSSWVTGVVDDIWQAVETLLSPQQLVYGMNVRSAWRDEATQEEQIKRAKNLALIANEQQVTLVISKWPEENQEIRVLIEVYPMKTQEFLPSGLKVKVMLENDSNEEIAGDNSNFIRVPLTEDPGKPITVEISLDSISVTERFIV